MLPADVPVDYRSRISFERSHVKHMLFYILHTLKSTCPNMRSSLPVCKLLWIVLRSQGFPRGLAIMDVSYVIIARTQLHKADRCTSSKEIKLFVFTGGQRRLLLLLRRTKSIQHDPRYTVAPTTSSIQRCCFTCCCVHVWSLH